MVLGKKSHVYTCRINRSFPALLPLPLPLPLLLSHLVCVLRKSSNIITDFSFPFFFGVFPKPPCLCQTSFFILKD